ncbi:MAG: hypothetical protein RL385_940 [Pseudomonadota bacterium]|jgi:hypothetical protein
MSKRISQPTVVALAFGLLSLTTAAEAQYRFTSGVVAGTKQAAATALTNYTCGVPGLTVNRLAAIMLSIPLWEVAGGTPTYNPSPMVLSRWDKWRGPTSDPQKNWNLFSFNTEEDDAAVAGDDRRAHWNPGVGLWQLDTFAGAMSMNHARRIDTSDGGVVIARYLRDAYCADSTMATLKTRLRGTWFACRTNDQCYTSYSTSTPATSTTAAVNVGLYTAAGDKLNITEQTGSAWDGGGIAPTMCRFGTAGGAFACSWVDPFTSLRQGVMDTAAPNGYLSTDTVNTTNKTPIAAPFVTFNFNSRKYMAWLTTAGLGSKVIRYVAQTLDARNASGVWTRGTDLQVNTCSGGSGCWTGNGM